MKELTYRINFASFFFAFKKKIKEIYLNCNSTNRSTCTSTTLLIVSSSSNNNSSSR